MDHPTPIFLAPVVDAGGCTIAEQIDLVVARNLEVLREEHEQARRDTARHVEMLHARLEVLETRWHERLLELLTVIARWFRGLI